MAKLLLVTPPFTQLNTPYPATAYLKGFLEEYKIEVDHCDLSIELFNKVYSKKVIESFFKSVPHNEHLKFPLVWENRMEYISKIETVISFLKKPSISEANFILAPVFLPKGHRWNLDTLEMKSAFEGMDILNQAKYKSTLFVEELGDFIQGHIDEFFSFTRYAEQIATSASSFDTLNEYLQYEPTLVEDEMLSLLDGKIKQNKPTLVGFTIPFPGNLFSALRCAQYIKYEYPQIKIAFGGGYCNTELLSLREPRIFNYVDYITTGDGESPLLKLIQYLEGQHSIASLERTFVLENNKVVYKNKTPNTIFHHSTLPAPNYQNLPHKEYLSFLDVMNPMHQLWTDGKWNKLTVSHGCYWKQCSFCDVSLSYIADYQNTTAVDLVTKIEKIIADTGSTGFHFVDEAAPPKVLKALANLLMEREIKIKWWTNIRFEKTFTPELCELLAKSGCIAVTGGLEVASDRLLKKMNKGVDIKQVAKVTRAFTKHNVMVHAYLMYGFPTQTEQETVDSLEVVRQLFSNKCIQSGFWHKFTTTIHSPIGKNPDAFGIQISGPKFKGFAKNDLTHIDSSGANHETFKNGLNLALKNYLNGIGFDVPLQRWFEISVPSTSHSNDLIERFLC